MTTLTLKTWLNESPSTATVTLNGTQVFNGEVGAGQEVGTTIDLCTMTATSASSVSVAVNTGYIKVGKLQCDVDHPAWDISESYNLGNKVVNSGNIYVALQNVPRNTPISDVAYWAGAIADTTDWDRSNILIDGVAPAWPPVEPFPGGTEENPDWDGWFFDVPAGSTITFDIAP